MEQRRFLWVPMMNRTSDLRIPCCDAPLRFAPHSCQVSLWLSGRASERWIRRSEVRFLLWTQSFFFVPRSWQDERCLSPIKGVICQPWNIVLHLQAGEAIAILFRQRWDTGTLAVFSREMKMYWKNSWRYKWSARDQVHIDCRLPKLVNCKLFARNLRVELRR